MTRPRVVLNVSNGDVQGIFSSIPDLEVLVVDWNPSRLDCPSVVELSLNGQHCSASVVDRDALPIERLAGSDVAKAIGAARDQEVFDV
jgi:hypothetical protein